MGKVVDVTTEIVIRRPTSERDARDAHGIGPVSHGNHVHLVGDDGRERAYDAPNRGDPTGFLRIVAPFMARAMRRANRKDLALLRTAPEGA